MCTQSPLIHNANSVTRYFLNVGDWEFVLAHVLLELSHWLLDYYIYFVDVEE